MNVTENQKNSSFPILSAADSIAFGAIFASISILGCLGNILVIVGIACDKKMRKSSMNVILLNLAVADLGNILALLPDIITALYFGFVWHFGAFLCRFLRFLEYLFVFTSISQQLLVCIERYEDIRGMLGDFMRDSGGSTSIPRFEEIQ